MTQFDVEREEKLYCWEDFAEDFAPEDGKEMEVRPEEEDDGGTFITATSNVLEEDLRAVLEVNVMMMRPKYTVVEIRNAQRQDICIKTIVSYLRDPRGIKSRGRRLRKLSYTQKRWVMQCERDLEISKHGVLLKKFVPDKKRPQDMERMIVMPQLFQWELINLAHDAMGHQGEKKTLKKIAKKFDWPGMGIDVARFVATCVKCTQSKGTQFKHKFKLKPIVTTRPNQLLQIDFEKLMVADNGKEGLLVVVDHFTKFARAFPMRSFTAKGAALALHKGWCLLFGVPEQIQSDQGSQFESELFREFTKAMGTIKIRSTPYHPQCNGLVERQNKTFVSMLRVACSEDQKE
jgi:hypothetical protein